MLQMRKPEAQGCLAEGLKLQSWQAAMFQLFMDVYSLQSACTLCMSDSLQSHGL